MLFRSGMAAVFAFQAPASAAPEIAAHQVSAVVRLDTAKPAGSAQARRHHRRHSKYVPVRLRAYWWALSKKGHPYVYGGTGPGYDCSGLVMMAYRHAGIHLPRTTYGMLASSLLIRVRVP